jgi:uncharacterized cysteine cluster protein YcgN (CxxCxxCC family)
MISKLCGACCVIKSFKYNQQIIRQHNVYCKNKINSYINSHHWAVQKKISFDIQLQNVVRNPIHLQKLI